MNTQFRQPDSALTDVVDAIRAEFTGIRAVYLFGSRAMGSAGPESDLDLAVLSDVSLPAAQLWELAQRLAAQVGCDVDLVDLRQASTVMRMQVISRGRRIFCSDTKGCEAFEDFVFADHSRLNEERAAILTDIRERGNVLG